MKRCDWALTDPLSLQYHDEEWGNPCFEDKRLFEFLILEGAQAGLSWRTILQKRENFRLAYNDFDATKIACYNSKKINSLLNNSGIIRNKLKIESTIQNARGYLAIQQEFGGFSDYLWRFVEGKPIINHWRKMAEVPAKTTLSDQLSKDLKQRKFNFVGSTICYAYMQAVGMVNDHLIGCVARTKKTKKIR
ncbi:MAG: DNA-3-methyladenine glycosylase [Gammaproteobacteria bacterium RIFCSPHIGHO2_12_FULL_35_23]|nr:MAG: DNA-3-methyladenine glycosylase [Gammaproteobacteria bacterium RIFCSPHIGHO2_12_FULL_35_23]